MLTSELVEVVDKLRIAQLKKDKRLEKELTDKRDECLKRCKPTEAEFYWAMEGTILTTNLLYWLAMHAKDEWSDYD